MLTSSPARPPGARASQCPLGDPLGAVTILSSSVTGSWPLAGGPSFIPPGHPVRWLWPCPSEMSRLGAEGGTQLPEVAELFRDEDGIQIPLIRPQTLFPSETLCPTRGGQAGFMGCPNTTLSQGGWTTLTPRDSASRPLFPHRLHPIRP